MKDRMFVDAARSHLRLARMEATSFPRGGTSIPVDPAHRARLLRSIDEAIAWTDTIIGSGQKP